MFFGWGSGSAQFPMPDGRIAVCTYKYISVLFIFTLVTSQKWRIVAPGTTHAPAVASDETTAAQPWGVDESPRQQIQNAFFPGSAPNLSLWRRFGLLVPVLLLATAMTVGAIVNAGTTALQFVETADCFVISEASEFERLETPDCSEPHDSQIVAVFDADSTSSTAPAVDDRFWETVWNRCVTESEGNLTRRSDLPANTLIDFLAPTDESWEDGSRQIMCYIHSPAGLEGSFVLAD